MFHLEGTRIALHDRSHRYSLDRRLDGSQQPLDLGPDPYIYLDIWIVLYSVGQVLLLLLICTLVFRKRTGYTRGLALINMLWTMFLNAVVVCILYYAGEQANAKPPTGLCLCQATLKHGTGPMMQVALLCLGVETFLSIRAALNPKKRSTLSRAIILGAPYATFVIWSVPVAIMGSVYPNNIERLPDLYYCSYANNLYGNSSTIFGILAVFASAVMQVRTTLAIHRCRSVTRKVSESVVGGIDLGLIVRLYVFVGFQIFFIILTAVDLALLPPLGNVFGMGIAVFEALVPIMAFAIFGIRTSTMDVWFWWCKRQSSGGADAMVPMGTRYTRRAALWGTQSSASEV